MKRTIWSLITAVGLITPVAYGADSPRLGDTRELGAAVQDADDPSQNPPRPEAMVPPAGDVPVVRTQTTASDVPHAVPPQSTNPQPSKK